MDTLMDYKAALRYLKVSRMTLYRLVKSKQFPATKVGRMWRFSRARIDKWLSDNENIKTK